MSEEDGTGLSAALPPGLGLDLAGDLAGDLALRGLARVLLSWCVLGRGAVQVAVAALEAAGAVRGRTASRASAASRGSELLGAAVGVKCRDGPEPMFTREGHCEGSAMPQLRDKASDNIKHRKGGLRIPVPPATHTLS